MTFNSRKLVLMHGRRQGCVLGRSAPRLLLVWFRCSLVRVTRTAHAHTSSLGNMSQSKKPSFDLSTFPWKTAAIAGAAVAGAAIGGFLIGRRSAKDASNDAVVEDKIAPEKKSAYKTPPLYTFKAEYLREFTQKVFEHFGASVSHVSCRPNAFCRPFQAK